MGGGDPPPLPPPAVPPVSDVCWVLASLRPGFALGTRCAPSGAAMFLGNKCLDYDGPAGGTFVLEKILIEKHGDYERE
eukprot:372351-Heterocapsa_arctica.AAC.1